jgi:hypothetical protein
LCKASGRFVRPRDRWRQVCAGIGGPSSLSLRNNPATSSPT